jgi:hypothetical protein
MVQRWQPVLQANLCCGPVLNDAAPILVDATGEAAQLLLFFHRVTLAAVAVTVRMYCGGNDALVQDWHQVPAVCCRRVPGGIMLCGCMRVTPLLCWRYAAGQFWTTPHPFWWMTQVKLHFSVLLLMLLLCRAWCCC